MKMFTRGQRVTEVADTAVFLDDASPRLVAPNPAQLMWMEELREFLRAPHVRLDDVQHVMSVYLDYCTRWHAQREPQRWNPNTTINALGVALGDLVRGQRPDLRWAAVEDSIPTALALVTEDGEPVVSPLDDVAYCWMNRELTWMADYVARFTPRNADLPRRRGLVFRSAGV